MNSIWSIGVRKLPSCSSISLVMAFKICQSEMTQGQKKIYGTIQMFSQIKLNLTDNCEQLTYISSDSSGVEKTPKL